MKFTTKVEIFLEYGLLHNLKCRLFHGKNRITYPLKAWNIWGYKYCEKCKKSTWNLFDVLSHPEVV